MLPSLADDEIDTIVSVCSALESRVVGAARMLSIRARQHRHEDERQGTHATPIVTVHSLVIEKKIPRMALCAGL